MGINLPKAQLCPSTVLIQPRVDAAETKIESYVGELARPGAGYPDETNPWTIERPRKQLKPAINLNDAVRVQEAVALRWDPLGDIAIRSEVEYGFF